MATKAVGNLAVNLIARTKGFTTGLQKATKRLKKFGAGIAASAKRIAKWSAALTAAAVGAFAVFTKQAFASIDTLAKVSDKLGITTENLAGLRHAAELTGVNITTLDMAIQRMTRRIAEAAMGTGEAKAAIAELGLDAQHLKKIGPGAAFREIAGAMSKVKDEGDKVRLSFKLFDSEGVALKNTLALGTAGLDAMQAEAEKLGLALSRVDAAQVEAANDAITRMKAIFKGFFQQVAIKLAPVIQAMADKFTEMADAGSGVGPAVERGFKKVVKAIGLMADAVHTIQLGFLKLKQIMLDVFAAAIRGSASATKGLVKFAGILPGTGILVKNSGIDKAGDIAIKASRAMADKAGDEFNQAVLKSPPSVAINKWVDDIAKKARDAAKKIGDKKSFGLFSKNLLGDASGGLKGLTSGIAGGIAEISRAGSKAKNAANIATLKASLLGTGFKQPAVSPATSAVASNSAGAALQRGSVEAFQATRFAKRGDDPMKKVADNTKQQLAEEKKANKTLDIIAGFLKPTSTGNLIPT